jgi:L-lactate dehydrogenase complex protein LldF
MPAVHKSRADVADLFSAKLGVERTEEIEEMTALARRLLRERFAAAEMGVTGVNFAVAETGTIVLVENEGNIRLTTSLPRVHVALMGLEKVLPRLADLDVFLKLLTRSASGQKITASVSLLTGVKLAPEEEGAEELHVVIIDNGRTRMLANPRLRESLFCIRCGACLNACPVYQKIGGHAYGWVYPGPIGAVLTPQLIGRRRAASLPFASSLCGACHDACPIKINIPDMLLHLRHEIKESAADEAVEDARHGHATQQVTTPSAPVVGPKLGRRLAELTERGAFKLWAAAMGSSRRYEVAARLMRLAQRAAGGGARGTARVLPVGKWTTTRDFPPLAARSFRERWRERATPRDAR